MEAGKTQASLQLRYSTPADQGCWLCRFKQNDPAFHQDGECKLLKIFYPYSPAFSLNHASTNRAFKTNQHPTPTVTSTPLMMCYDAGTFPLTLCDKPNFFSSLQAFESPKTISLGDDNTLVPALGHGLLDYVIDGKFRIQEEAILTACTPIALKSAASHIKYDKCAVSASANSMTITYPTFSHTIPTSDPIRIPHHPRK